MRGDQVEGLLDGGAAQSAAASGLGETKIDDFPDVAIGNFGQQQDHGGGGLARYLAQTPALGHEPPGGAVALDHVVERAHPFELGHVQAGRVSCLQDRAELGLVGGVERSPLKLGQGIGGSFQRVSGRRQGILVSRSR